MARLWRLRKGTLALVCAIAALAAFACVALSPWNSGFTGSVRAAGRAPHLGVMPTFVELDHQAELAKHGDETAIRTLTNHFVQELGVHPEVAKAYGFNERIVQAELAYRHNQHPAIKEEDVTRSVNNLMSSSGAPSWAQTDAREVHKLRMLLIIRYPHMMASEAPPDSHGRYRALDDTMSPLEGAYVAGSMLHQKLLNPEFQFTREEQKDLPDCIDLKRRAVASSGRTATLRKVLYDQSANHSVRDMLRVSDNFLSDLKIAPVGQEESK